MSNIVVNAGEVCSIDVAMQMGIYSSNFTYYNAGYSDVKTYNTDVDGLLPDNTYKLCETTRTDLTEAVPLCLLQTGAGFGFKKNRSDGSLAYDQCITAECPTGFTENENSCVKPRKDKTIFLNNIVEERWYDWFMIPDYHLGNKYARVDNVNYGPCKKGSIPSYGKDPVDNAPKSFNDSESELGKCVDKAMYFQGKYFTSETYCPLAWVFRAGATKTDLKNMYNDLISSIDITTLGNGYLDNLKNNVDNLIHDEIYDPVLKYGFKDYVGESQSAEAKAACKILENDPDKMREARIICDKIKQSGKENYINKLMRENSEDEKIATQKYTRAIQACHVLFCDNDNTEQICFEEVGTKNLEKELLLQQEKDKVDNSPIIDPVTEKPKIAKKTFNIISVIIILALCIIILIFAYPVIYKIIVTIYRSAIRSLGYVTTDPSISYAAKNSQS